jgi:hypothetical protein
LILVDQGVRVVDAPPTFNQQVFHGCANRRLMAV